MDEEKKTTVDPPTPTTEKNSSGEQRTPAKSFENTKYIETPSPASEDQKSKALNASGSSSRDKKHR